MTDIPEDLGSLLDRSRRDKLAARADENREAFANELEQLARDIRSHRESPYAIVAVLLTPDGPSLPVFHGLTTKRCEEAGDVLRDIEWNVHALADNSKTVEEILAQGHQHRLRRQRQAEAEQAANLVAKPYKCEWCSFRSATVRGRDQHMRWQKDHGCSVCGGPRCSLRGTFIDYAEHYRGVATCGPCRNGRRPASLPANQSEEPI